MYHASVGAEERERERERERVRKKGMKSLVGLVH
jgi:hypothetical protein